MRLSDVRVAACRLCRISLLIGHGLLNFLLRCRIRLEQRFLSCTFLASTDHVGVHCVLSGLRGSDLSLGVIDSGESALYLCVFQLFLPAIVFNGCPGSLNRGGSLRHLRAVVVVFELNQNVPLYGQSGNR